MTEKAVKRTGKTSDLAVRLRSAVLIGVITLTALYSGGAIFASFMAFVTAVGAMEWYQMVAANNKEDTKARFYIWTISALATRRSVFGLRRTVRFMSF